MCGWVCASSLCPCGRARENGDLSGSTAKSMKDLDWEAVATLLGDVATVKRSITRLNGRLNGMDNEKPKFNWEEQAAQALAKEEKPVFRGG